MQSEGGTASLRPSETERRERSFAMTTSQLGMIVLLISLSVVFIASLFAYGITRAQNPDWLPPGHELPSGLLVSTVVILGVSALLQVGLVLVRKNQLVKAGRALMGAAALAGVFLILQTWNWVQVRDAQLSFPQPTLFAFTFYLLTGLHALHVLGGFVPLGIVMYRAAERQYSSSRHEGVALCVQYWHFLGVVWLVLLGALHTAS